MKRKLIERLKELRGSPDAIIVPRKDFDEVVEIIEAISGEIQEVEEIA